MHPRERILCAVDLGAPDRVPVYAQFVPQLRRRLERRFGVTGYDLEAALGNDMLITSCGISTGFYASADEFYRCEWGITWRNFGLYTEMHVHPLADATADDLAGYPFPDPARPGRYDDAERLVRDFGSTHAIVGAIPCTIFEGAWYLRGLTNLLSDLKTNKDFAHRLMDRVMAFHVRAGLELVRRGVDIIWTGDDVGAQDRMLMSPETWREFLKPRYQELFSKLKSERPSVKIAYHSDGHVEPILPELMDIGLDILNPVQPRCMDPARLKALYGSRLSFWGSVDEQHTLPFGTPEDVEREVRLRFGQLGRGGGFILGPTHNVQADTSVENVIALYEAARKWGVYGGSGSAGPTPADPAGRPVSRSC